MNVKDIIELVLDHLGICLTEDLLEDLAQVGNNETVVFGMPIAVDVSRPDDPDASVTVEVTNPMTNLTNFVYLSPNQRRLVIVGGDPLDPGMKLSIERMISGDIVRHVLKSALEETWKRQN
jgi:hypothetical protein